MPKSTMKKWSEIETDEDGKWSHFKATMSDGTSGKVNSQTVATLEGYQKLAEEGHEFQYEANQTPRGTNIRLTVPRPAASKAPYAGKAPYTGPKKDPQRDSYWEKVKPAFDEKVHSYHLVRDQKIEHQFYVNFASPFFLELLKKMEAPKTADAKKLAQAAFETGTDLFSQVKAAEAEAKKAAAEASTASTEAKEEVVETPAPAKAEKKTGKQTIPAATKGKMPKANVEEFDPFDEGEFEDDE